MSERVWSPPLRTGTATDGRTSSWAATGHTSNSGQRTGPRFLPRQPLNLGPGNSPAGGALEPVPGRPEWRETQGAGGFLPYESVVTAIDWNLCWFERSFLEHGYAPAQVTAIATR
jgi:hypothetical protein